MRNVCPKKIDNCTFCKNKGHQEQVCRTKLWKPAADKSNTSTAKTVKDEESEEDEDGEEAQASRVYHRVSALRGYTRDTPRLDVQVRTKKTEFAISTLPDTGVTRSLISLDLVQKHDIRVSLSKERLYTADDSPLKC